MINSELTIKDIKNEIINVDGDNYYAIVIANKIIVINYQGKNTSHFNIDILFTLPSRYCPSRTKIFPFTSQNDAFEGQIYVNTNGNCVISRITANTYGRIILNIVFFID